MNRFYIPDDKFDQKKITITDQKEIHHLHNVMRYKVNDAIELFNGKGVEAVGTIQSITSKKIVLAVDQIETIPKRSPQIILACAIPKKTKFETIIEKCTELGTDTIIPLKTQRSEIQLNQDRMTKKIERYKSVALSAAKQSHRSTIPEISNVQNFTDVFELLDSDTQLIIPSLIEETKPLIPTLEQHKSCSTIAFFIGPEGDFTEQEYALAQNKGAIPVTLGPNILRVETAAISVISCANLIFNN